MDVVGLLQFTPTWAAENPDEGQRSVPKNLSLPANDPNNYWAAFAGRMAAQYKGRIDRWVIWNEPEFKPGDKGAGQSYSWLGSDQDYYLLLKRAYQAIKAANPNATVIFGATSYWVDINMGRAALLQADPRHRGGRPRGDRPTTSSSTWPPSTCTGRRTTCCRIFVEMKDAMKAKGIDKPIWLTETNAMPYDDPATPKPPTASESPWPAGRLRDPGPGYGLGGGLSEGGLVQDRRRRHLEEQEVWGLVRDDGSPRPAFQAFKTVVGLFKGAKQGLLRAAGARHDQPFGTPWPQDPNSYYPNWRSTRWSSTSRTGGGSRYCGTPRTRR